jgi:hypothetical protein
MGAESVMVNTVHKRLLLTHGRNLNIYREVVLQRNRIDMLIVGKGIYAIEFKHDPKYFMKGIAQTYHHLFAVDYSVLCIPYLDEVPRELITAAKKTSVGLFMLNNLPDPIFIVVVKPPKSILRTRNNKLLLRFKSQTIKFPKYYNKQYNIALRGRR